MFKYFLGLLFILALVVIPATDSWAASFSVKPGTWKQGDWQMADFEGEYQKMKESEENQESESEGEADEGESKAKFEKAPYEASPDLWNIYVPYLGQEYANATALELYERLRKLEKYPAGTVSLSGDSSNLNGKIDFNVNIDHAEHVEIKLVSPASGQYIWLGDSKRVGSRSRALSWDSTQTPNGIYVVEAFVSNIYGRYELTGPTVTINNKGQGLKGPLREKIEMPKKVQAELSKKLKVDDKAPDGDSDGLPDSVEASFGSDPLNPDSDGDGFLDGFEVAKGYDPNSPTSPGQAVGLPKSVEGEGEVRPDVYKVENIEKDPALGEDAISIKGSARPGSFALVYVYSELPTMITVRTDDQGNFKYTLTRALDDGQHRVYVGLADVDGTIAEKSQPRFFTKVAQAITVSESHTEVGNSKQREETSYLKAAIPIEQEQIEGEKEGLGSPVVREDVLEVEQRQPNSVITPVSPLKSPLVLLGLVAVLVVVAVAVLFLMLGFVLEERVEKKKRGNELPNIEKKDVAVEEAGNEQEVKSDVQRKD